MDVTLALSTDVSFLSMVDGFHLHLGHKVAFSIHNKGTNHKIFILFVGPYITWLVRGIRCLEETHMTRIMCGYGKITLGTLRSIGMLKATCTTQGTEYWVIDTLSVAVTGPDSPSLPPAQCYPRTSLARTSFSHATPPTSSLHFRRCLRRLLMRITNHLGMQRLPPQPSPYICSIAPCGRWQCGPHQFRVWDWEYCLLRHQSLSFIFIFLLVF